MNRKTAIVVSVSIFLIVGIAAWARNKQEDQETTALKQLQAEVFSKEARELPEEERREKFTEYQQRYDQLSESQRRMVRGQMRDGMQQRMSAKIHEYFTLPKSQRVAFLDRQINDMEKRRRQFASRRATQESRTGGRGGPPDRGARGRNMTEAEKKERRDRFKRAHLGRSTPQQRAEMSEYIEALRKRREERGLPERGHGRRGMIS